MATTATSKGTASPGTKPNNAKAGGWVKQHKVLVVLGVVAVVALWALTRKSAQQNAATTSSDPYGLAGMPQGPVAADPYGGSGLTDPNSVAGLMEQLLAGQAGLGDQLNALAANPGEASTTTAKGGGGKGKSGHHGNGQSHGSHQSDGRGGHHKPPNPHGQKPKLGGAPHPPAQRQAKAKRSAAPPFTNPTRPTARQRQALARTPIRPRPSQPQRRR